MRGVLRRFEVAERSMMPSLQPGDYLLTVRSRNVQVGQVVVFQHPERHRFWLVKRVERVDSAGVWVISDDAEATLADSRTFGPLPRTQIHRVVLRYWPPRRASVRGL